jgi:hypothetical protein
VAAVLRRNKILLILSYVKSSAVLVLYVLLSCFHY